MQAIALVAALMCGTAAWGTTYYVSSSLGNDANSGTSTATPWRTLGHVNGQTFQPGDSILLRRGDVWNESLVPPSSGTSGNPISFDAYGTGAPPNLTGYYAVPPSAWVNVTGNAWKAQLTPVTGTYTTINFCLFGSVWGQKVSPSSSNLTAQWDFYLANGYLYVFSVGNPGANPNLLPIVPMALSDVPVINVNGQTWLSFQHILVNWFDDYGVYVQGASDHLVFANMEVDSLIPQGTQPLGFYVDEATPGPGDIKIYNSEAHLNYDGFRFDGAATAVMMVNDKGYGNRDGALVDNTSAVNYSHCHFYASSLAVAGSTDVEWTSGTGPTAGAGNIPADTQPAVKVWQRYPARVTLTVDDAGMTAGADTYYAGTVLPVADAAGVPVGAAITVGYPLAQTLISEFQSWINAGRDVTSHSISHTYYTNTNALNVQYTGSGTAATLSISGKVLTITVTGASDTVSYNISQGQAQGTIGGLNTALTGTGKFTTSYSTPCQGPYGTGCSAYTFGALLSQDLADVSGIDVKTSAYSLQLNVTRLTTDEITLSRAWMTTNLTGLPATPVYVYPGGYETPTMQGITAGVPYVGARGALNEDLGVSNTYASGFDAQNITSFGVNPSWQGASGVTPAMLNQKIQALVWKEQVWGVPWGVFWHNQELTQTDPVGGTEITNLIQDFKNTGATVLTNTGLVNWLTTGTQETGTDGNYYYKSAATSAYAANGGVDFRPTAGSPVVDAGENLGTAYAIDLNGLNQNNFGTGWEIGAHAFAPYFNYGQTSAPASSHFTIGAQVGQISSSYFGMQCGVGYVTGANNCPDQTGTDDPTWPTSQAQPGLLRLWDSQTAWSWLMTAYSGGVGTYSWAQLDGYLDVIAAHQPITVNYVFGCVPVFASGGTAGPTGSCSTTGGATPPSDLTTSGSPTFTQFVTDLVNHCSPAGNCFSTYVNGFELWNEANESSSNSAAPRWNGTQTQLYQMLAPAVAVIRGKIPGARVFTPSITSGGGSWMTGWLNAEIAGGIISNVYNIHEYLNNNTPETVLSNTTGDLAPNTGTSGWTAVPWVMTETGYDNVTLPYNCNAGNTGTLYSTNDCVGQMVRWNLLLLANGGSGLYWYYWNTYIGSVPQYATAYYYMMQYLAGGRFTAAATFTTNGEIQTWSAPFVEGNGTAALWVWTTSEAGTSFTVPVAYGDYRDLNGNTTTVTPGSSISISVEPIMLEEYDYGNYYSAAYSGTDIVIPSSTPPNLGAYTSNAATAYDTSYVSHGESSGNLSKVVRCTDENTEPSSGGLSGHAAGQGGSGSGILWNSNSTLLHILTGSSASEIVSFSPATMTCGSALTENYNLTHPGSSSAVQPFGSGQFDFSNPVIWWGGGVIGSDSTSSTQVTEFTFNLANNQFTSAAFVDNIYGLPLGGNAPEWSAGTSYSFGAYVTHTLTSSEYKSYQSNYSGFSIGDVIWPEYPSGCGYVLKTAGTTGGTPPNWTTTASCGPNATNITDGTAHWVSLTGPPKFLFQLISASGTSGSTQPVFAPSGHPDMLSQVSDSGLTWENVGVNGGTIWGNGLRIAANGAKLSNAYSTNIYGAASGSLGDYGGQAPYGAAADQGTGVFVVSYDSVANKFHLLNTATDIASTATCSGGTGYACSGGSWTFAADGPKLTAPVCPFYIHSADESQDGTKIITGTSEYLGSCGGVVSAIAWYPYQTYSASGSAQNMYAELTHEAYGYNHVVSLAQSASTYGYTSGAYTNLYQLSNPDAVPAITWQPTPCDVSWYAGDPNLPCQIGTDQHLSWAFNPLHDDSTPAIGTFYSVNKAYIGSYVPQQAYANEVVAFSTQPSWTSTASPNSAQTQRRFTHTWNYQTNPNFNIWFAIGQGSQDGRFYAFSTDWYGNFGSTTGSAPTLPVANSSVLCLGGFAWQASTNYALGAVINPVPSLNGGGSPNHAYQAVAVTGASGSTEPVWPDSTTNGQVTDGGVTWQNLGTGNCRGEVVVVQTSTQ